MHERAKFQTCTIIVYRSDVGDSEPVGEQIVKFLKACGLESMVKVAKTVRNVQPFDA